MALVEPISTPRPSYDQLVELLDVVRYMGVEKDLDRLLEYIGEHCIKAIAADRCSIFLLDRRSNEIYSRLSHGEEEIRFSADSGLAGECIRSGVSMTIADPYKHPLFNKAVDQVTGYRTQNLICVPLTNLNDEVIGCFQVINKIRGLFTEADHSLLLAFAAQAGIALESALLQKEAKEAERLATVGRLTATIVHDFRSPMTTIWGMSDLIRGLTAGNEGDLDRYVDVIERELERFKGMMDELLDFSRGEYRLRLEAISVKDIFEDVAKSIASQAKSLGVNFEYKNLVDGVIKIDSLKIRRVILNLTNNSFDAMGRSGILLLQVMTTTDDAIKIVVADSGPGIPEKIQGHVFNAFYASEKSTGTGLGLHIAKEIIEAHGGSIRLIDSRVGAVFEIVLPRI